MSRMTGMGHERCFRDVRDESALPRERKDDIRQLSARVSRERHQEAVKLAIARQKAERDQRKAALGERASMQPRAGGRFVGKDDA
jgi:hypothetical protein